MYAVINEKGLIINWGNTRELIFPLRETANQWADWMRKGGQRVRVAKLSKRPAKADVGTSGYYKGGWEVK